MTTAEKITDIESKLVANRTELVNLIDYVHDQQGHDPAVPLDSSVFLWSQDSRMVSDFGYDPTVVFGYPNINPINDVFTAIDVHCGTNLHYIIGYRCPAMSEVKRTEHISTDVPDFATFGSYTKMGVFLLSGPEAGELTDCHLTINAVDTNFQLDTLQIFDLDTSGYGGSFMNNLNKPIYFLVLVNVDDL